ncbi:MAG: ribosomal-protein-alanine N-acetyltransferase [Planctomycetota bacterium]|jgi:ribosomal-protein-alanine N-acetyltransferase
MRICTELPNCWLRPWRIEDKPALLLHGNNREVWRNLTDLFLHPYTEDDADFWVRFANQNSPSIHFAIEFDGEAVGGIGAIAGEGIEILTARFGYWIGEAHWGQGIATAAGRAMVAHVESTTKFARIEAAVYEWNPASIRIFEKLGFAREGVLRKSVYKDGQLTNSVMFSHIREAEK